MKKVSLIVLVKQVFIYNYFILTGGSRGIYVGHGSEVVVVHSVVQKIGGRVTQTSVFAVISTHTLNFHK